MNFKQHLTVEEKANFTESLNKKFDFSISDNFFFGFFFIL